MNIEFGTSNRGRPTLIYQGYEYVKKQETNTTTHWICRHYRQIKCSSLHVLQLIPNANPERIMMDFEKSAVNAFSATFPTAQITGCYFHLCQSVLRKINEVGLKKAYTTTPELALALKMVPATAFLPVEQVEDGFNLVMEEVGDILLRLKSEDEVSEKVEQFACYFQKTYIRGTSRAPLFEPSIWNQNNAASEGLARTNNAVEGWHYGIQSLFSGSHPDVWTFLQKFRQDALLHKFNALQAVTGHQKKPRRKYQQLNGSTFPRRNPVFPNSRKLEFV